jgi:hypothetical protein
MEDLTLPSVGTRFKKWGVVHTSPKVAQALATCKGLQKQKKSFQKIWKKNTAPCLYRRRPMGHDRRATVGRLLPSDRWSPGCRATADRPVVPRSGATSGQRPLVGERSAASDQWPLISGRRPLLRGSPFIQPPCPFLPTSLTPNFSTCGQLFFSGSSTCLPCLAQISPKNFKHL